MKQEEVAALFDEWKDAYAAFVGAFDTPVQRRKQDDPFAIDARERLRKFNEEFQRAAGVLTVYEKPESSDRPPVSDLRPITRGYNPLL